MEERFKDMTPYGRAVRISLYSNRIGKMEEQKDHTEDPEVVKALEEKIKETQRLIDEVIRAISVRRYLWIMKSRNRR